MDLYVGQFDERRHQNNFVRVLTKKPLRVSSAHEARPRRLPDALRGAIRRALTFVTLVAFGATASRCFLIRSNNFSAGSSLGSCATNSPRNAFASTAGVSLSTRSTAARYFAQSPSARENSSSTLRTISKPPYFGATSCLLL